MPTINDDSIKRLSLASKDVSNDTTNNPFITGINSKN